MNIQIDMDKLNAHVGKAVEKAVRSYLVMEQNQQLRMKRKNKCSDPEAKIISYIKSARKFHDDARYTKVTSKGYMPYSKLLALMKLPSVELRSIVDGMLERGLIVKVDAALFDYNGDVLTAIITDQDSDCLVMEKP